MNPKEVRRIIDKYEKYGSVEIDLREENPGRPPKFQQEDIARIRDLAMEAEDTRVRNFRDTIEEELNIDAGITTVYRALKNIGRYLTPTWTPLLTQNHKDKRLAFCENT